MKVEIFEPLLFALQDILGISVHSMLPHARLSINKTLYNFGRSILFGSIPGLITADNTVPLI